MFGMGFGELIIVLLVALIFLGPEKIPKTAQTLGRWVHELKRALDGVKEAFESDIRPSSTEDLQQSKPDSHEREPRLPLSSPSSLDSHHETKS